MRLHNVIQELEAIEAVRAELRGAENNIQGYEILGRLLNLYSALNVRDLKAFLVESIDSSQKAA